MPSAARVADLCRYPGRLCGAPCGARFQQVQVLNPPGSGKDIAEGKSVHREAGSEGSWMWGNILTHGQICTALL